MKTVGYKTALHEFLIFFKFLLILERKGRREGGRERETWIFVLLTYAVIGRFLYVPCLGIEPTNWNIRMVL